MKNIIVAKCDNPPIPNSYFFSYRATLEGYEPGDLIGYGITAAEAEAELVDKMDRSLMSGLTLRIVAHDIITSADLYCLGMESETAYRLMPQLCAALGVDYPPQLSRRELSEAAQAFGDPFTESPQMRQSATDSRR